MLESLKFNKETLGPDLGAGLTVALVSIPEGMAYALVAGVNPIYGLYTGIVTTIVASLTASTSLLIVTLTNAMALVAGEQLLGLGEDADPVRALFTLTLMTGVIMFGLGRFKLGGVIRYVSREVMSGFIFATALLIILGQYKDLVGYASTLETNKLFKAIDITLHAGSWNVPAAVVGFGSILVLLLLKRSPFKKWADIAIILLATLFVVLIGWERVELVGDIATVPRGLAALPKPVLPDFSLIPALISGAIAAAVVGLAESSGIAAAFPNRDGSRSDMSKDFASQGLANLVGSFFQGMPASGSLSRTGINRSGGALSRWGGVYSGVLLAVTLVLFGGYAELIPMPGLAALLIVIGLEVMLKEGAELIEAWQVSRLNTLVAIITILVGVFTDLTVAIFTGVILSLLLYTFVSAGQFKVVTLVHDKDGKWFESPLPATLPSNQVTIIEIRGNLFFASVYSFDELLPAPDEAVNAVVILRARDRRLSSLTGVNWLVKYHHQLTAAGNKLMFSGVEDEFIEILKKAEAVERLGIENIFLAEAQLFASTEKALAAAQTWLSTRHSTVETGSDAVLIEE
ncbi:MAG: SulP family inorganic anion transporter [Anaerolineae bacterium]|nr:SulP family inorganic anion transporter [Anaerolineae bacterium]